MTTTPEVNDDFVDMLMALQSNQVEFLIVGAYALAAHGFPRATGDIDIFVEPTADNAKKVYGALLEFGAPVVTISDFETKGAVYQIGLPPRRIDLLTSISGVDYAPSVRSWARRDRCRRGSRPESEPLLSGRAPGWRHDQSRWPCSEVIPARPAPN